MSTALIVAAGTFIAIIVLGFLIRNKSNTYFTKLIHSFQLNATHFTENLSIYITQEQKAIEQTITDAIDLYDNEIKQSKDKLNILVAEVTRRSETQLSELLTQRKKDTEKLWVKRFFKKGF